MVSFTNPLKNIITSYKSNTQYQALDDTDKSSTNSDDSVSLKSIEKKDGPKQKLKLFNLTSISFGKNNSKQTFLTSTSPNSGYSSDLSIASSDFSYHEHPLQTYPLEIGCSSDEFETASDVSIGDNYNPQSVVDSFEQGITAREQKA